ncbi:unnamed protein product [Cyclocybe aegerita]|uniref:Nephrocystin 3-like N-terminal domain-containing protein n=1 Tax=Cyclocybe aegerita TaxID=1973307 RepID=A0A8S0WJ90_CYCAE|nr:unnamed protein product [Cyclocybe aegerita]
MFSNSDNVLIHGGVFNQTGATIHHHQWLPRDGFDILHGRIVSNAFHNSSEQFDAPKCHPNTRTSVLETIMEWVTQHQVVRLKPLLWLYGAAGAGKSAICRTIAERYYGEGLLVATFFFSRTPFEHNSVEGIVATLAYQLALSIPSTRDHVRQAVENDPSIFERDLGEQFEKLIAQPVLLSLSPQVLPKPSRLPPKLVIIDGLDKC